ncbi:MAG: hypothetical protein PHN56_00950 [Candidatus Nanoarchaeia archaeon]|nr:hypothetical protein [Candidatus Nanoarchaeia archaeon]
MAFDFTKIFGKMVNVTAGVVGSDGTKAPDKISIKSGFNLFLLLLNFVLSFVICAFRNSEGYSITTIVFIVIMLLILIFLFIINSTSKIKDAPLNVIVLLIFFISLILVALPLPITVEALMNSFFFSLTIILTGWIIIKLFGLIFGKGNATVNVTKEGVFSKEVAEGGKTVNMGYNLFIFQILRTIALAVFLMTFLWVLISSPFSFFGGSLYGGFMHLLICVPLMMLLSSFWNSGSNISIILIIAGSFATYMLSFMFPTLFANLWVLSTTSSASAGASTISSFNSISPMGYYKSTYIVKTGQTEKKLGPTYELISDDVLTSTFEVQGRLCDESILVASLTFQNKAKFELKDLSLQMSALRDPYCTLFNLGADVGNCNVCEVNFTLPKAKGSTYSVSITNLPKGVPRTVNVPFKTRLKADVMEQICKIRSNILVHYHTTSVFPLSFMDYDAYLISPKNIGNPLSTSSFGKVLISMDIGQQPVVVNDDTKINDQVLLKMAWSQKGDGLVNTPQLILYLPESLGKCQQITNMESYQGSGGEYTGIYGYNEGGLLSLNVDFKCTNYKNDFGADSALSIKSYCNNIFSEDITIAESNASSPIYFTHFTPEYDSSFEGMPSFNEACEDLASKGYSVCVATDNVQNDLLLCPLSLQNVDVSEVDLSTYLIRADALYSFNSIREEQFTVSNCNAI